MRRVRDRRTICHDTAANLLEALVAELSTQA